MSHYPDPAAAKLNEGFVVTINIAAKEGEGGAVADNLERLISPTMEKEGVQFFMPYCSSSNPNAFVVYELYRDASGLDAHNASVHFQCAVEELSPKVVMRGRTRFVPYVDL